MRIAFVAFGTRGDVHPFVVLAKGFADAGHELAFITDEGAKPLVAPYGIPAHYLAGDYQERWSRPNRRRRYSRYPYGIVRAHAAPVADLIASWAVEAAEAGQGSKLVVGTSASFGLGHAIAERIRAFPCVASVMPIAASRYVPPSMLPWPRAPLPGRIKLLLAEATSRAVWLAMRDVANAARRALRLQEVSWPFGRHRPRMLDAFPELYGFSPTLLTRPPDWPHNITITGTWQHRGEESWPPPPGLVAFLEAGPPPIYVGFGSMFESQPSQLWDIVARSIRELGLRAVIAKGWSAMAEARSSDDVFVVESVPHGWLFPRVAAVVHHGGSGTVGATLRAGKTSVVIPYIADQPFWGWALERLGVAPRMIPRNRLSKRALTAALARAMDGSMQRRASDVGEIVRTEDGVRRAVEVIEAWMSRSLVGAASRQPA
jgi:sterol 3beta-glucosyltransferase